MKKIRTVIPVVALMLFTICVKGNVSNDEVNSKAYQTCVSDDEVVQYLNHEGFKVYLIFYKSENSCDRIVKTIDGRELIVYCGEESICCWEDINGKY